MSSTRPITPRELERLFPHATKSTHEKNSARPDTGSEVPDAKPERDEAPTLGDSVSGEKESLRRTRVRFTLCRVQLLDPDNAAGSVKDLLDGLRHSGLIAGDEWYHIRLEVDQEKVAHYRDEKTVIIISNL